MCAITNVATALLDTFPPVVTQAVLAAAVTRTPRTDSWGHFSPLLKVKCHPIDV